VVELIFTICPEGPNLQELTATLLPWFKEDLFGDSVTATRFQDVLARLPTLSLQICRGLIKHRDAAIGRAGVLKAAQNMRTPTKTRSPAVPI
jgi:hypothetical protein